MERRNEAFWRVRLENMKANGEDEKVAKAWIKCYLASHTDRPKLDSKLSTLVLNDVYHGIKIPRVDDDGRDSRVQERIDELKLKVGRLAQEKELYELEETIRKLDEKDKINLVVDKKVVVKENIVEKKPNDKTEVPGKGGSKRVLPPRPKAK